MSCDLSGSDSSPSVDISIAEIEAPDSATKGDTVSVEVTVRNESEREVSENINVSLENQTADTTINSKSVSRLAENGSTTLTYSWHTEHASPGEHILRASHDFEDEKSNNNSRTTTLEIAEPEERDIAITDAKFPSSTTSGDEVEIEVTLENNSTQLIEEEINISLEDQTDEITIGTETISEFEAGSVANIKYTWNTGEASIGDHTLRVTHNFDDDNDENNFFSAEITISEQQNNDLAVTAVSSPSAATRGDEVEIEVTLENAGNQSINENIDVTLNDETENTTIGTQTISELEAGATTTLTYNWETEDASTGDHELVANHNFDDDNSNNNSGSTEITISEQQQNDLAITGINAVSSAEQGELIDIEVTLENSGNQSIDEQVNVTLENHSESITIGTENINGLEEGASVNLTFTWDTGEASTGEHELEVSHALEDDNSANNSAGITVTISEPVVNDIAITEVNAPSSAEQGAEIDVEVTVENTGNQSLNENTDVTLEDRTDNVTIGTQTISELEAGATTTLTYSWNTGEATTGDHELEALHALEDDDNSNNSQTTTVTISEPAETDTDIAITELNAPASVTQGDTADIDATIENIGDTDFTESITVTFMHHQETLGTETIEGGLDAGISVTVTYSWDTTGEGTGSPPHPIDVSYNIQDEDNTNNEDTVEILVEEPEN